MKRIAFVTTFVLMSSVEAGNQPKSEKEEVLGEHKVLTGLNLTGAAIGAGLALYGGHTYYSDNLYRAYDDLRLKLSTGSQTAADFAAVGVQGAAMVTYLYPACSLGSAALRRAGFIQADDQSTSEKEGVAKEHKVVSGLKAAGASVGAVFGLLFTYAFAQSLLMKLSKPNKNRRFEKEIVTDAMSLLCGAYTAYKLGYRALPCYINRIRGK